jgi:AAA15 family ATPase/GTPase
MINSLEITNYRNLKKLNMPSLGRINLIIGKNNTGKTSVLEAIAIYAAKGDLKLITQLLEDRGETIKANEKNNETTETNIKVLSSIFSDRNFGFNPEHSLSIISDAQTITLRFVKYIDEVQKVNPNGSGIPLVHRMVVEGNGEGGEQIETNIGFEVRFGEEFRIIPLDRDRFYYGASFRMTGNLDKVQLVSTRSISKETNGTLWDKVTFTDKEQAVIEALQIIEPKTERVTFVESARERFAVVKLSGTNGPVPLRSMGDGINRIFTIILALVNAENGFLLIDEFENGLHYTVQEQLWKIIFELSQKLNIQVFATTHSEDTIVGFQGILRSQKSIEGKVIRLDNVRGNIKVVAFDAEELKIVTENNMDIR